jgi:KUP system potassium uptake protein
MVFWTWARGLEDEFDGVNRRNLSHIISKSIIEKPVSSEALKQRPLSSRAVGFEEEDNTVSQVVDTAPPANEDQDLVENVQLFLDVGAQEKVVLPRMSTIAIFHKLSSGKGVPHTFYGFLKQWPALPRVVVRSLFRSRRQKRLLMGLASCRSSSQYESCLWPMLAKRSSIVSLKFARFLVSGIVNP